MDLIVVVPLEVGLVWSMYVHVFMASARRFLHHQALEFFAEGRVLFGTDTPMDMAGPGGFHSTSLQSLEESGACVCVCVAGVCLRGG